MGFKEEDVSSLSEEAAGHSLYACNRFTVCTTHAALSSSGGLSHGILDQTKVFSSSISISTLCFFYSYSPQNEKLVLMSYIKTLNGKYGSILFFYHFDAAVSLAFQEV